MKVIDQENFGPFSIVMSFKKKDLSPAMKRTSEWISSQEIPSDVTIHVGGTSFALHKFPLVTKCGCIRQLVSESTDPDLSIIEIPEIPGGAEAFELAAKFCYGINFEIGIENIAKLRCVSEYLEMTEEYVTGNLVQKTEAYLNEVALKSLTGAVTVLHMAENMLPMAERVKLVGKCVDAIAYLACKDSQFCVSGRAENGYEGGLMMGNHPKVVVDWWAEDLSVLRIDFFQRVLIAMVARGFKQYYLGPILMLYAQKSLRGLEIFGKGRKKIEPQQEHEKRVVIETIVSLLPREKNAMSVSFLSMLLRSSIYLETTIACRLNLEKKMGLQLAQTVLDDLLIPSYSFTGDTLFDVETVQRILMNYLELELDGNRFGLNGDDGYGVSQVSEMERVWKLMENYLAEIASDRNLSVVKFIGLAELIPEQSRVTEDGMYRAIDIYLKAHPDLMEMEMERKKVCSLMDCQKLSREACAHAAQNDRLPVQTVVQVLYYEKQRLRDAMNGGFTAEEPPAPPPKINLYSIGIPPVPTEISSLKRENEDLKMEVVKMKMKLTEIERTTTINPTAISPLHIAAMAQSSTAVTVTVKSPLAKKWFMNSVSKKLGRLYPFVRADGAAAAGQKGRTRAGKNWRHLFLEMFGFVFFLVFVECFLFSFSFGLFLMFL